MLMYSEIAIYDSVTGEDVTAGLDISPGWRHCYDSKADLTSSLGDEEIHK